MLNQKEGTYNAVCSVVGEPDGKVTLTKEQSDTIITIISTGFFENTILMSPEAKVKYKEPKAMKEYVRGLLNNWIRKDTRLNGGGKYVAKNPGSRAGSGDELLKTLKVLRSTQTDPKEISNIDLEIAKRQAELNAEKQTKKMTEINTDLVPENLRHLLEK